jgi:hypothetical protein
MEAQVLSRRFPNINEVQPLNENDTPVMQDIYRVLEKHNALKRFGVTLLHEHFDLADDEIMMETTNVVKREQRLVTMKRSDAEQFDSIETSWCLETGVAVAKCRCDKYEGGHDHFEV